MVLFILVFSCLGVAYLRLGSAAVSQIQGMKVVGTGSPSVNSALANVEVIYLDGPGPGSNGLSQGKNSNNYFFPGVSPEYHRIGVWPIPTGWQLMGVTVCYDRTDCHGGNPEPTHPNPHSYYTGIPSVVVDTTGKSYADVWWHFKPIVNPPTITLNTSPTSVAYGGGTTVAWSATNNVNAPTACSNNFGGSNTISGSFLAQNLTANRTFTVTCSNTAGSVTASKVVSVAAKPNPVASNPSSTPKTPTSTPTPVNSSTSPSPAARKQQNNAKPQAIIATNTPDTQSPTTPANFQAYFDDAAIELTWINSTDNVAVSGYIIERSTDNANWEILSENALESPYRDNNTIFNTEYFYRIRATDTAKNVSEYALTSVRSGSFSSNINPDTSLELTSDDGRLAINLPVGAVEAEAVCSIGMSNLLPPSHDQYDVMSGPYEIVCKLVDGSRITSFKQPVAVSVNLSNKELGKYTHMSAYVYQEDWNELAINGTLFGYDSGTDIVLLGKAKKAPFWQKALVAVLILLAIIAVILIGLQKWYNWKTTKAANKLKNDYYNKEHGY